MADKERGVLENIGVPLVIAATLAAGTWVWHTENQSVQMDGRLAVLEQRLATYEDLRTDLALLARDARALTEQVKGLSDDIRANP